MYKPRVYGASMLHHYGLWQVLAKDPDWDFVEWTASWPNVDEIHQDMAGEPVKDEVLINSWMNNVNEVLGSDFVLLYAGNAPKLRGALIEAGVAIGAGIPVCTVGLPLDHTWRFHRQVKCFATLQEAKLYLYRYTVAVPPNSRKRKESE